jgi:hypothetical protein
MQKYYCSGMSFYGDKIPLKFYEDRWSTTLFIGLYFQEDYNVFSDHIGNKIVFWNGSDVSRLLANENWQKILKRETMMCNDKHYCHNKQLQDELKSVGIEATIVPLFFGNKEDYQVCYKHSEIPQVFMNAHPGREEEYGVDKITLLDKAFPYIKFHIYGITGKGNCNIIYHGQIPEKQMDDEIKNYQGCLRFNQHDGMSQIVAKSNLMGLYVINETELIKIIDELNKLNSKKEPFEFDRNSIKDI